MSNAQQSCYPATALTLTLAPSLYPSNYPSTHLLPSTASFSPYSS